MMLSFRQSSLFVSIGGLDRVLHVRQNGEGPLNLF